MPNDAKMGMVAGLGLVVAIALLFFHKESATELAERKSPRGAVPPAAVQPRMATGTAPAEVAAHPVKFVP